MKASSRSEWADDLLAGFAACYLTCLPVLLGVSFEAEFLHPSGGNASVSVASRLGGQ